MLGRDPLRRVFPFGADRTADVPFVAVDAIWMPNLITGVVGIAGIIATYATYRGARVIEQEKMDRENSRRAFDRNLEAMAEFASAVGAWSTTLLDYHAREIARENTAEEAFLRAQELEHRVRAGYARVFLLSDDRFAIWLEDNHEPALRGVFEALSNREQGVATKGGNLAAALAAYDHVVDEAVDKWRYEIGRL